MSIKLLMKIIDLNQDITLDIARILILLKQYFDRDDSFVIGTTKIAKMDFLLRYPTALERALMMKHKTTNSLEIKEYERDLVESKMIRYKFGPWDERYWSILSVMESMNLLNITKIDGVTSYSLTEVGKQIANLLESYMEFSDYIKRSKIIAMNFGNLTATTLMKKVYQIRPELTQMKLGEEIKP